MDDKRNLIKKYEKRCMFRADRLDGGGKAYGSLVTDGSAMGVPLGPMLPPVVTWHIVQYGSWNGRPLRQDYLVDPETIAMYLGQDDEDGHGIYVPLKDVAAAFGSTGRGSRQDRDGKDGPAADSSRDPDAGE